MKTKTTVKTVVLSSACVGAIFMLPTKGDAALGDQELAFGMKNGDVKKLQEMLVKKGYLQRTSITGYYGSLTKEAVKKFQHRAHLHEDGIVGKQTLKKLLLQKPAQQQAQKVVAKKKTSGISTLSQGMQGPEVVRLQRKLKELSFFRHSEITGYYGRITAGAVKEFQRSKGLAQTGVADQSMLKSLYATSVKVRPGPVKPQKPTSVTSGLKMNDRGERVRTLQVGLKALGYYSYTLDGIFGTITKTGVSTFQQRYHLPVTGVADDKTMAKLKSVVADKRTPPPPAKGNELRLHARGAKVETLQSQLKVMGYYPYAIDGVFGAQTEAGVKAFQKRYGIFQTGVVDVRTHTTLVTEAKKKGRQQPPPQKPPTTGAFNPIILVADAVPLLGTPYTWGGNSASEGFDCSGFLVYLFKKQNIQLPRTVSSIWSVGKAVSRPKVGDIVFFETYKKGPSHAGIYVGNNRMVHSGSRGVEYSDITISYWKQRYLGAKQLY
ncbi:NLP/P60 protein [Fictibacillus macauensis ZFHKF-1]|uniref:NLP/P60 protein n=1 Tax=Fictibacillus macauensis ZFHKF-1 TaxID=1196324 RepID=I8UJ89_9BACL|nr:peptidoglycan-binding protein [Fictibacillus macauensis]EIT86903.1 NLP/P60 protein [Fictibacillus macauensis ZFHKF-1]